MTRDRDEILRRVKIRMVDVRALRKYLGTVAVVALRGADHPDVQEVLATAQVLFADAPRGLGRLGVR